MATTLSQIEEICLKFPSVGNFLIKGIPTLYQMQSNQTQAMLYVAIILNRRQTAISEGMLTTSVEQGSSLPLQLARVQTKPSKKGPTSSPQPGGDM